MKELGTASKLAIVFGYIATMLCFALFMLDSFIGRL